MGDREIVITVSKIGRSPAKSGDLEALHGCGSGTKGQRKRSDEIRRFRSRKHHILKARQAGSLVRRHAEDGRRKYRLTNKAPRAGVQLVVRTSIKMEVRGSQARGRPRVKWVDIISYDMNECGFEEVDTRKTVEDALQTLNLFSDAHLCNQFHSVDIIVIRSFPGPSIF